MSVKTSFFSVFWEKEQFYFCSSLIAGVSGCAWRQNVPSLLLRQLNMSPNYLSDILRHLTGQNAQQHIHNKLIERAKQALSTTSLSISEISYVQWQVSQCIEVH